MNKLEILNNIDSIIDDTESSRYSNGRLERIENFLKREVGKILVEYLKTNNTEVYGVTMFKIIIERILYKKYGKLISELGDYIRYLLIRNITEQYYEKRIQYYNNNK